MRIALTFVMIIGLALPGAGWASGYEFDLSAGSTSVAGAVQYKNDLRTGYLKAGVGFVHTDDDDTEYQWIDLDMMLGNQTFAPGLTLEVGLNGLFGDAEQDGLSGDVGAIAFAGRIEYLFPRRIIPLPLELFATLAYAPDALAFRDTKNYVAYAFGAGFRIVPNATLFLEYADYDLEMETDTTEWDFDDDVVRLGIRMRF